MKTETQGGAAKPPGRGQVSIFFSQLKAMLRRNILLKKREKRKTTSVRPQLG